MHNQQRDIDYFPSDYVDSRSRFRQLAQAIPGTKKTGSWQVPSQTEKGLSVDYVWLPPTTEERRTLFVITSGVHGSEGYAGSAVQQMFFNEILPKSNRANTGFFLAHAMNPYGFKLHRRGTEANINLNRNCSVSHQIYSFRNHASERLNRRFLSRRPVASVNSALFDRMQRRDGTVFFEDVSLDQLVKGISPGQFERPHDLEYGGSAPEPQIQAFIAQMREIIKGFKNVLFFDLHTGLGDRDRLHLLIDKPGQDLDPQLFSELFDTRSDSDIYTFTPPEAEGFYEVHGSFNSIFGELKAPDQRVCALTLEYGTLGHSLEAQLEGLNSFVVEHEGYVYGYAHEEIAKEVKRLCFERSYPQRDSWREAVVHAARGLFGRVVKRAGGLAG